MNRSARTIVRRQIAGILLACFWASAPMTTGGCAKAPPSLSPSGVAAFHASRAVDILNVVRDATIAAHDQGLVSTPSARAVVSYYKSALQTIRAVPSGWLPTVRAGLDEVERNLSPAEQQRLASYVRLARTVFDELQKGGV